MTTGRLPPWLKISSAASSGPTPSRQPTVPGYSQLVKYFIIFFWSRSCHLLFQILFAVNKDSGAMEGYIAPYNEYYMVILSQPDHNILSWLIWNIVLLSCQWIIALHCKLPTLFQVAYLANMTSSPGSKAAQHFATFMGKWVSWPTKQWVLLTFFSFSSDGAPPGANGHPVPITYEGFTLLTDNYNNYFMSSFIPQVPLNKELQSPKICSPVQLLPDPRLPNEPLPASANFWLDASWQTILEVRASTRSNFWLQNHLDQKM